jgi:hypothetical protein
VTILLFWTAVGVLTMVCTWGKAFGRVPTEEKTTFGYGVTSHTTTKFFAEPELRRWFRVAFFAGLLLFLTAGSLAALAKDMG